MLMTKEQYDNKVRAAGNRVETARKAHESRSARAVSARAEAQRLIGIAGDKERGAADALIELNEALRELDHRKAAPYQEQLTEDVTASQESDDWEYEAPEGVNTPSTEFVHA